MSTKMWAVKGAVIINSMWNKMRNQAKCRTRPTDIYSLPFSGCTAVYSLNEIRLARVLMIAKSTRKAICEHASERKYQTGTIQNNCYVIVIFCAI